MAEIVRAVELTDKENLPEEFNGVSVVGKNERGKVAVQYEDGRRKELGESAADLLLKTLVSLEKGKDVAPPSVSPELMAFFEKFEQRFQEFREEINGRLDGIEGRISALESGKTDSDPETPPPGITPEIRAYIDSQIEEKTKPLTERIDKLEAENKSLKEDNERLEKELAKAKGETPPDPKESEISEGDEVAIKAAGGKYKPGYEVVSIDKDKGEVKIKNKADGTESLAKISDLKKRSEVKDDELVVGKDDSPKVVRKGRPVRPLFMRRMSERMPGSRRVGYYEDDEGYYKEVDGEQVTVTREEAVGRDLGGAAIAATLGVGAALGIALWELGVEKWFGFDGSSHHLKDVVHNQSTIIHNQGIQIHDLNQVNDHLTHIDKELLHAHDHDRRMIQGLHNQIHRAAKHQDRIINDLRGDIARDHLQETRSIGGLHDKLQNSGVYWGVRYPWDWAATKVGSFRAEGWLHTLASRAADHGHKVVWLHNRGKEVLQIDGSTNTSKVVSTLNQYR